SAAMPGERTQAPCRGPAAQLAVTPQAYRSGPERSSRQHCCGARRGGRICRRCRGSPMAGWRDPTGREGRRFADSAVEGDGFEPSVPGTKEPVFVAEGELRDRTGATKKVLFLMRYRWFESISLQRGVRCKPDSRVRQCSTFLALPLPRGTEGSNP